MDVGFYLGELLMRQGEVSVPGLGYFVQARMSGYYDENEGKFYPPYHQAQFDVQSIDDDSLAEYIAVKKNISVASAKYFSEKYITSLKQEALIGEVPIGNLGWFYTELTQLAFRPADKIIDDTIFYGFEGIKINKIGTQQGVEERPKVELNFPPRLLKPQVTEEVPEAVPEPAPIEPAPVVYEEEEAGISHEFFDAGEEGEEEEKSPLRAILILIAVLVILGVGAFALYRYKPEVFSKMVFWKHKTVVVDTLKAQPKPIDTTATDTLRSDTATTDVIPTKDTVAKTVETPKKADIVKANTTVPVKTVVPATKPVIITKKPEVVISKTEVPATKIAVTTPEKAVTLAAPIKVKVEKSDATGTRRFEVYAATVKDMAEANRVIKKLKKDGYDARVITDAPEPLIHITIGHFQTKEQAVDFAKQVIEAGKIRGDVYAREIIPQ